jgi:hypothetical protein
MTREELLNLLAQQEGPTLEFKQQLPEFRDELQRDEFVKDILSLVNGNVSVVGQSAYLVFGASNVVDVLGQRTRYDVGMVVDPQQFRDRVVQIMGAACKPPISNVLCEVVDMGDARLVVLTLPPSQHLHETTRPLKVAGKRGAAQPKVYDKHIVFMRVGATTDIAAATDRDAIRERKQRYFNESNKVSPVRFASGFGALVGWVIELDESAPPTLIERIQSSAVGGVLGFLFGAVYRDGMKKWRETPAIEQISPTWRDPIFIAYIGAAAAVSVQIVRRRRKQHPRVRTLPEQHIVVDGQPALLTRMENAAGTDSIDVLFGQHTLEIIGVDGGSND